MCMKANGESYKMVDDYQVYSFDVYEHFHDKFRFSDASTHFLPISLDKLISNLRSVCFSCSFHYFLKKMF